MFYQVIIAMRRLMNVKDVRNIVVHVNQLQLSVRLVQQMELCRLRVELMQYVKKQNIRLEICVFNVNLLALLANPRIYVYHVLLLQFQLVIVVLDVMIYLACFKILNTLLDSALKFVEVKIKIIKSKNQKNKYIY